MAEHVIITIDKRPRERRNQEGIGQGRGSQWVFINELVNKTLGQYRLEELVGYGGMGAVYRSTNERLRRDVAVKVMIPSLVLGGLPSGNSFRDRFLDEARIAAMLGENPNIVTIYDYGVEGEIAYFVMQYAPDGTLKKRIDKGAPLSLEEIARYLDQACNALEYAHQAGVIHRDIKPHNFLLAGQTLLLSDFGIARLNMPDPESETTNGSAWTLTAEGHHPGTPAYMAPEQGQGGIVDQRSDIYSLGVTLYEMLCGKVPFTGKVWEVIYKHIHEPPPPLLNRMGRFASETSPKVLQAIEVVMLKALAKNPQDRYQSAPQLAQAFYRTLGPLCPTCNYMNRRKAKFCFRDGAKLPMRTGYRTTDRIRMSDVGGGFCFNCLTINKSEAKYCNHCGQEL